MERPDILLLGAEWRERALLRAQLLEAGHTVVAIDAWPMPPLYRLPGMTPRLLLINLRGLPNPRETLDAVRSVMPADRVLVLSSLATIPAEELRTMGFTVIERPTSIGQIVMAASALLRSSRDFS